MHDDQHIARLYLLDQGIRQGHLYPRWVDLLGFGYGYPLFNFYPPLVYYLAELFHLIGFSYIWSIKLVFISGFILGAFGIYSLAKRYVGEINAYLATVVYNFFTYHAVLIYVRGALAEFFSYSLLPFVFLSIDNLARKTNLKNVLFFTTTWALLLLAHPLIAAPSLIFIGLYFIYFIVTHIKDKLKFFLHFAGSFILGLFLSAFYWLPSMVERRHTLVDEILTRELASFKIHFVYPSQFWYSQWGYGGSLAGPFDGISFQLGKINIFLILTTMALAVFYFFKKKFKTDNLFKDACFFTALSLLSLFMTTSYSLPIWENLKSLWYLQFPWRFLTIAGLFIAIVAGYSFLFLEKIFKIEKKRLTLILILAAALNIYTYGKYFHPQTLIKATDEELTSNDEITWRVSRTSHEFIPKGAQTKKTELNTTVLDINQESLPKYPYEILAGDAKVKIVKNNFSDKQFLVDTDQNIGFALNTFNFPGWNAYLNNRKMTIVDDNKYKLITVNIPPGENKLRFRFENTNIRRLANVISVVGLALFLFYFGKSKKIKR
jgi:hypothetical protein